MARRVVTAWLVLNVVILVLYTGIPPLLFNDGAGRIAGVPEMLFWFMVLPLVVPGIMAVLYLYDRRTLSEHVRGDRR